MRRLGGRRLVLLALRRNIARHRVGGDPWLAPLRCIRGRAARARGSLRVLRCRASGACITRIHRRRAWLCLERGRCRSLAPATQIAATQVAATQVAATQIVAIGSYVVAVGPEVGPVVRQILSVGTQITAVLT